MKTGFFWAEETFWHGGGNYALTLPVGGLVQPLVAGGLPEGPETKRRFRNLLDLTGLSEELVMTGADRAEWEDLARVHPESYLQEFKKTSDSGGGELGLRTPFGPGAFEIAARSAGLAKSAIEDVARGTLKNAYALCRPPGHHCLPDWPNGFCLLNNIAIGVEAGIADGLFERVAIVDWDVHHGNGTEAIYYDRADVLTISVHQEKNYPLNTGDVEDRGNAAGLGTNVNIPLPPGVGHDGYVEVMERIIVPAIEAFNPDIIIVASGYDASAFDPLSRMLATAESFTEMTRMLMRVADDHCDGKLVCVHEGGYSEAYVPFCGHAVMTELAQSEICAPDPMQDTLRTRQPNERVRAFHSELISEMAAIFNSPA